MINKLDNNRPIRYQRASTKLGVKKCVAVINMPLLKSASVGPADSRADAIRIRFVDNVATVLHPILDTASVIKKMIGKSTPGNRRITTPESFASPIITSHVSWNRQRHATRLTRGGRSMALRSGNRHTAAVQGAAAVGPQQRPYAM